jgi:hypothetical protein
VLAHFIHVESSSSSRLYHVMSSLRGTADTASKKRRIQHE